MTKFELSQSWVKEFREVVKSALWLVAEEFADDIRSITPRDPKRPPKDLSQPVTGNLQRSISYEVNDNLEAVVGVDMQYEGKETKTPLLEYARYQEFWTPTMRPRSYLRRWVVKFGEKVLKNFAFYLKKFLS